MIVMEKSIRNCRNEKKDSKVISARGSRVRASFRSAPFIVLVFLLAVPLISAPQSTSYEPSSGYPTLQASVDFDKVIGSNNLSLGMQIHGYDDFPDKPSLQQEAQIGFKIVRVFVTRDKNTEPCLFWNETSSTGIFDWSHIDPLVNSIFGIGAEPLLNVGAGEFPDIVVPSGMTENYMGSRFPNPQSFGSYVATIARHIGLVGRSVRFWEIWRTPQIRNSTGWIDAAIVLNYTKFFNVVQDYIHRADPNTLVSSDRTFYRAFFDIFIKNAKEVGYLSFMKYDAFGTPYNRPEGYIDGDELMRRAGVIDRPVGGSWAIYSPKEMQRKWLAYRGKTLPVVVIEANMNSAYGAGTDPRIQTPLGSAWYAEALKSFILDGTVSYSTYYRFCSDESYLWGSGRTKGWGLGMVKSTYPYEQWYPYWTNYLFGRNLQVGDSLFYTNAQNSTRVSLLAWGNSTNYFVVVIGKTNNTYNVALELLNGQVNRGATLQVYRIDNQHNGLFSGEMSYATPIISTLAGYSVTLIVARRSQPVAANFLLDDGFESGSFSNWTGTYTSFGETKSVVSMIEHHGNYSAIFTSNGGGGIEYSFCYETVLPSAELSARGYFCVSQSGVVEDNDHLYLISLRAGNYTVAYAGWWNIGGTVKWCLVIRNGTETVVGYATSSPSINQWYRVELHWKKGTSGFAELRIDGMRVCSFIGVDTATFGTVTQVRFGLPGIYYCTPTTVYVDCAKAAVGYIGGERY